MPEGTLQGVQYLVTSAYIMIVGFIDQTQVNLAPNDYGGELDPHGSDLVSPCSLPSSRVRMLMLLSSSVTRWVPLCTPTNTPLATRTTTLFPR